MNWLRKFMYGRYGLNDALSKAMLALFWIFLLLGVLSGSLFFQISNFILIIFIYYRMFSKNVYKRRAENMAYLQATKPIRNWFQKKKRHMKDGKTHRFFQCPNCSQELRVPKGKGEVTITCPKCHTKFDKRT